MVADRVEGGWRWLSSPLLRLSALGLACAVTWSCSTPVEPGSMTSTRGPSVTGEARAADPEAMASLPSTPVPTRTPDPKSLFSQVSGQLRDIQDQQGSAAALAELDRLLEVEPAISRICHAIAHELGHRALTIAQGKAAVALAARNDTCGGGFTHGVVENALADAKDPSREMLRLCAPNQDGSCWHGIGHGLMFANEMDPDSSNTQCDKAPSRYLANRCGEGVYMQLFSPDLAAHHAGGDPTLARDPERAMRQCARTRATYRANCWFYAPIVWLTANPERFIDGISWCAQARPKSAAEMCAKGMGSRAVKYHPDDLRIAATTCAAAGRLQDPCLLGMASYWSVHHKGAVAPGDVCGHLPVGPIRQRCSHVT